MPTRWLACSCVSGCVLVECGLVAAHVWLETAQRGHVVGVRILKQAASGTSDDRKRVVGRRVIQGLAAVLHCGTDDGVTMAVLSYLYSLVQGSSTLRRRIIESGVLPPLRALSTCRLVPDDVQSTAVRPPASRCERRHRGRHRSRRLSCYTLLGGCARQAALVTQLRGNNHRERAKERARNAGTPWPPSRG